MTSAIYDLLFILPLTIAASCAIRPLAGDDVHIALWYGFAAVASVYFVFIRYSNLRRRIIAAGVAVTAALAVIFYQPKGERISFLKDNLWVVSIVLIVLACMLFVSLSQRSRYIRITLAALLVAMMPALLFAGYDMDKPAVVAIWAVALFAAIDIGGRSDPSAHLVFVSPFVIAIILICAFIRTPDRPYDWQIVKTMVTTIRSEIAVIADKLAGAGWESDAPLIGFSDRGRIGGNLTGFGYDVLDIRSSTSLGRHLYLGGRIYDDFDGRSWNVSYDAYNDDSATETIETLSHISDIKSPDEPLADTAKEVSLTVEYRNVSPNVLFVPADSFDVKADKKSYHVYFYMLNQQSPIYEELTESPIPVSRDGWAEAADKCRTDQNFESYELYRQKVYESYLPDTVISDRLRSYMDEVLSGCESDHEKLSRIEQMLGECAYNDTPGAIPESISTPSDFLDWFVFDKREGYCSYYATAFVLLCRAYDIPARYVQGYRAKCDNGMHAVVRSTDAHAWPEAYVEGIGWLRFEPTPGMREESGWTVGAANTDAIHYIPTPPPVDNGELAENDEAAHTAVSINWRRIVIPTIAGVIFTLLVFAVDAILKRRRYAKLDERGKAMWLCRKNMQYLRRKGLGIEPGETLSELKERLTSEAGDDSGIDALNYIDTYEKLLYSDADISLNERVQLEADSKALKVIYCKRNKRRF